MNRHQRWIYHLVLRLPAILIRDTERTGLSLGFMTVGVTSFLNLSERDSEFTALYSDAVIAAWSIMLFVGGALTLIGMYWSLRLTERAGVALAGLGCFTYGSVLILYGDGRTRVVGVLFLALALIKLIRLLVSTAADAELQERRSEDR